MRPPLRLREWGRLQPLGVSAKTVPIPFSDSSGAGGWIASCRERAQRLGRPGQMPIQRLRRTVEIAGGGALMTEEVDQLLRIDLMQSGGEGAVGLLLGGRAAGTGSVEHADDVPGPGLGFHTAQAEQAP